MDLLIGARRYGRALVGSTHWGDHLVGRAIEDLIDSDHQPNMVEDVLQSMSRLWNGWFGQHMREAVLGARARYPESVRMTAPAGFDRQVCLLTGYSQFTFEQTAKILEASGGAVTDASRQCQDASTQVPTDVLIIEDDFIVAEAIKDQVVRMGHRCCCVAPTAAEALECAFSIMPGLIISDIKLADGSSGLDATRKIHSLVPVPTIFLTADPELVLTGAAEEPEFVLQKPYVPEQLDALVRHVLHWSPGGLLASDNVSA